jgi:hypothetical protein
MKKQTRNMIKWGFDNDSSAQRDPRSRVNFA